MKTSIHPSRILNLVSGKGLGAFLILLLMFSFPVLAAEGKHGHAEGGHDHAVKKAPHDGRLMESVKLGGMHVEFVVGTDKVANVHLYDSKLQPVTPSDQTITLILQGKDGSKTQVNLVKKEGRYVSESPLTIPGGAKVVLSIKAGGKTENLRFDLNMENCGGCKKAEYACSCGHH